MPRWGYCLSIAITRTLLISSSLPMLHSLAHGSALESPDSVGTLTLWRLLKLGSRPLTHFDGAADPADRHWCRICVPRAVPKTGRQLAGIVRAQEPMRFVHLMENSQSRAVTRMSLKAVIGLFKCSERILNGVSQSGI